MKKLFLLSLIILTSLTIFPQNKVSISIKTNTDEKQIISKEICGHFAEHLDTCVYGGLWVGEGSSVPNEKGYRSDVLNALQKLEIPVLR